MREEGENDDMGSAQSEPAAETEKYAADASWIRKAAGSSKIILILIVAAAAVIRFHGLANRGLWLDEIYSVDFSRRTLSGLFEIIRQREINMALYYVLLHFWMKLGGSEFFLRSMSVGFSVATVPYVYAVGSRLFGRNTGLIAAWLLAINAFHIRYAQEARAYALAILLATISTYLLVRNIEEPRTASWTLYGFFLVLLIYSHLLGLLIVLAHGASILFLPSRDIPWRGLARSATWFVCLTLPLAVIIPMIKYDPLHWVPKLDVSIVLTYLVLTAGNGGIPLLVLSAIAVVLLIVQASRMYWLNGRSRESWANVLVLFWFFLPLLVTLIISSYRPFFVPRLLLPCLPAFVLAVSAGITRLRPKPLAWIFGAAISLLAIAAIPSCYHLSGILDDWRAISSHVITQAAPGDEIFFYPGYASVPFEYYRARQKPAPEWPATIDINRSAAVNSVSPRSGLEEKSPEAYPAVRRFWMIFYHELPMTPQIRKNLTANLDLWQRNGWTLRQAREFPGVTALLFAATSPEAGPPAELPNLSHPDAPAAGVR